ncbi:hypothetical protein CLU79DRAFT_736577 [Phycomyces nitens]|nr:hypothetical protein CLU79DRAFT_736577 [Phycomyces nitens]
MDFSCGCLFDKKVKEPHFKKSRHFEDLAASFAINAKNEQLGAQYVSDTSRSLLSNKHH